jgi:hypothetical protein
MINSMLPFSMLSSCRCYSFDDNFFEVDVPIFDFTYFPHTWRKNIAILCVKISRVNMAFSQLFVLGEH